MRLIERTVQSDKGPLEKCTHDDTDPYIALFNRRNVPRNDILESGSSTITVRSKRTKSPPPTSKKVPQAKVVDIQKVHVQLTLERQQQKR